MPDEKPVKMAVVDGVRYRPEDVPTRVDAEAKQAKQPVNKARTTSTK